ncbi:hypothetical protein CSUI_000141 [Cystoisospora suis]|uniref:Uncharacterized protein n=1 Tax=Cystoisospora suis TaxID=483139 RepID=A0A2C6LDB8_9APIC|nr:hypothetical protein CSUI_000141 [Cystoisospora suis]
MHLASLGAVELARSAVCETFSDIVSQQLRTQFSLRGNGHEEPSYSSAQISPLGPESGSGGLQDDLQTSGPTARQAAPSGQPDGELVVAVYRMIQLRIAVSVQRINALDPHLHRSYSVQEITARLEECRGYLCAFNQLSCKERETYYWIPLSCSTIVYTMSRYLRARNIGTVASPFLAWTLACLDGCVPLLSPQYLGWKTTMALQLIRSSEVMRAFDDALQVCQKMLTEVSVLEAYEGMEPPIPHEIQNLLGHAKLLFAALSLKYRCWNQDLSVSTAVENLQQLVKEFVVTCCPLPSLGDPATGTAKGRTAGPALEIGSGPPLSGGQHLNRLALQKRLFIALLLEFSFVTDPQQRLVQTNDALEAGGLLIHSHKRRPCSGDSGSGKDDQRGSPPDTSASHAPGGQTGSAAPVQKKRKGGAVTADASKESQAAKESSSAIQPADSLPLALLQQCVNAAGGCVADILLGADKIEQLVHTSKNTDDFAPGPAAVPLVSTDSSPKKVIKKGRTSAQAGTASSGDPSEAAGPMAVVVDSVRAAQQAAAELPEALHVNLFLACFRYRHELGPKYFFSPPLVELTISSSQHRRVPSTEQADQTDVPELTSWSVLSCDLKTYAAVSSPDSPVASTYLAGRYWDWERLLRRLGRWRGSEAEGESAAAAQKLEFLQHELDNLCLLCHLRPVWASNGEEARTAYKRWGEQAAKVETGSLSSAGARPTAADPPAGLLAGAIESLGSTADNLAAFREQILSQLENGSVDSRKARIIALEVPLQRHVRARETEDYSSSPSKNLYLVYLRCTSLAFRSKSTAAFPANTSAKTDTGPARTELKPDVDCADGMPLLPRRGGNSLSVTNPAPEEAAWWTRMITDETLLHQFSSAHALLQPVKDIVLVPSRFPFSHPPSPRFTVLVHPDLRLTPVELQSGCSPASPRRSQTEGSASRGFMGICRIKVCVQGQLRRDLEAEQRLSEAFGSLHSAGFLHPSRLRPHDALLEQGTRVLVRYGQRGHLSKVIQRVEEVGNQNETSERILDEDSSEMLQEWETFLCSSLGVTVKTMIACGMEDAGALCQAVYTLTQLLVAREELRLARKYVRASMARTEEIMERLMGQSGQFSADTDPCLAASMDPLPYLLEEPGYKSSRESQPLHPSRSLGRREASSTTLTGLSEEEQPQVGKWNEFVLECSSLLLILYDLGTQLDLRLGEQPDDSVETLREKKETSTDAAKAEQAHAENLMRRQLQAMGNLDLSPSENHVLNGLGSNPYRLCLFWCSLCEIRRINAQQILSVAVRELTSAVQTEALLVREGWKAARDPSSVESEVSRPPVLVGRTSTSLLIQMPKARKNIMSEDAFVTLFGGRVTGSGISVTKLHTELIHTGFRHPPNAVVHIPNLTANANYHCLLAEALEFLLRGEEWAPVREQSSAVPIQATSYRYLLGESSTEDVKTAVSDLELIRKATGGDEIAQSGLALLDRIRTGDLLKVVEPSRPAAQDTPVSLFKSPGVASYFYGVALMLVLRKWLRQAQARPSGEFAWMLREARCLLIESVPGQDPGSCGTDEEVAVSQQVQRPQHSQPPQAHPVLLAQLERALQTLETFFLDETEKIGIVHCEPVEQVVPGVSDMSQAASSPFAVATLEPKPVFLLPLLTGKDSSCISTEDLEDPDLGRQVTSRPNSSSGTRGVETGGIYTDTCGPFSSNKCRFMRDRALQAEEALEAVHQAKASPGLLWLAELEMLAALPLLQLLHERNSGERVEEWRLAFFDPTQNIQQREQLAQHRLLMEHLGGMGPDAVAPRSPGPNPALSDDGASTRSSRNGSSRPLARRTPQAETECVSPEPGPELDRSPSELSRAFSKRASDNVGKVSPDQASPLVCGPAPPDWLLGGVPHNGESSWQSMWHARQRHMRLTSTLLGQCSRAAVYASVAGAPQLLQLTLLCALNGLLTCAPTPGEIVKLSDAYVSGEVEDFVDTEDSQLSAYVQLSEIRAFGQKATGPAVQPSILPLHSSGMKTLDGQPQQTTKNAKVNPAKQQGKASTARATNSGRGGGDESGMASGSTSLAAAGGHGAAVGAGPAREGGTEAGSDGTLLRTGDSTSAPLWVTLGVLAQMCVDFLAWHNLARRRSTQGGPDTETLTSGGGNVAVPERRKRHQGDEEGVQQEKREETGAADRWRKGKASVDVRNIAKLFVFCIQVLMLKCRWHQVVGLSVRFNALTGGLFSFAVLSYALAAQQHVVSLHRAAVEASREERKRAEQELGSLHGDLRRMRRRSALSGQPTRQERTYFHRKKCYDAVLDGQVFAYSLTRAVEARLKQELAEAGRFQSPGETQLRLARLHFSRVWHRLISLAPASFPAALSMSEERLGQSTPRRLPCARGVESSPSAPSPVDSGSLPHHAARPRDDCVEAALRAYRIAEHTLRRHQQVEFLSPALFEQGNLLCVAGRPQMACKAWSEAVDAAHRQMNVVSDKYLRADASATASGGSESDRGAVVQQRSLKSLSVGDITHGEQGSAGGYTGTTTRLALRSLLPLYFAARLGHFNALDYHLNAAQFAVQIVERFFKISEPHPSRRSQFFRFRSDGRITRYRMREACPMLSDLQALFEEGEACVGGQNAKVFLAALQWFAQILIENEINIQAAHLLLTLAEYVAADLCRHVRTVLECRLKRTMLLLRGLEQAYGKDNQLRFALARARWLFTAESRMPVCSDVNAQQLSDRLDRLLALETFVMSVVEEILAVHKQEEPDTTGNLSAGRNPGVRATPSAGQRRAAGGPGAAPGAAASLTKASEPNGNPTSPSSFLFDEDPAIAEVHRLSGGAWDVLLRCCLLLSEIFEATASLKQAESTLCWASKVLEKRFCTAPFKQDTTSLWMSLSGRDCSTAERAVPSCENKACDPREAPSLESDAIFPTPELALRIYLRTSQVAVKLSSFDSASALIHDLVDRCSGQQRNSSKDGLTGSLAHTYSLPAASSLSPHSSSATHTVLPPLPPPPVDQRQFGTLCAPLCILDLLLTQIDIFILKGCFQAALNTAVHSIEYADALHLRNSLHFVRLCQALFLLLDSDPRSANALELLEPYLRSGKHLSRRTIHTSGYKLVGRGSADTSDNSNNRAAGGALGSVDWEVKAATSTAPASRPTASSGLSKASSGTLARERQLPDSKRTVCANSRGRVGGDAAEGGAYFPAGGPGMPGSISVTARIWERLAGDPDRCREGDCLSSTKSHAALAWLSSAAGAAASGPAVSVVMHTPNSTQFSGLNFLQNLLCEAIAQLDEIVAAEESDWGPSRGEANPTPRDPAVGPDSSSSLTGSQRMASWLTSFVAPSLGDRLTRRNSGADVDAAVVIALLRAAVPGEDTVIQSPVAPCLASGGSLPAGSSITSESLLAPLRPFVAELVPLSLDVAGTRTTCSPTDRRPLPNFFLPHQGRRLHLAVELAEIMMRKGAYSEARLLIADLVRRIGRVSDGLPYLCARIGILHLRARRLEADVARLELQSGRLIDPNLRALARPVLRAEEQKHRNAHALLQVAKYIGSILSLSLLIENLCGHDFELLLSLYQEGIRGLITYFLVDEECQEAAVAGRAALMNIYALTCAAAEAAEIQRRIVRGSLLGAFAGENKPSSGNSASSSLGGGWNHTGQQPGTGGNHLHGSWDMTKLAPGAVKFFTALVAKEEGGRTNTATGASADGKLSLLSMVSCLSSVRDRCALFRNFSHEDRATADYLHAFLVSNVPRYRLGACICRSPLTLSTKSPGFPCLRETASSPDNSSAPAPPLKSFQRPASSSNNPNTLPPPGSDLSADTSNALQMWENFVGKQLLLSWCWLPSVPFDSEEASIFDPYARQWTLSAPQLPEVVILLVCARGHTPTFSVPSSQTAPQTRTAAENGFTPLAGVPGGGEKNGPTSESPATADGGGQVPAERDGFSRNRTDPGTTGNSKQGATRSSGGATLFLAQLARTRLLEMSSVFRKLHRQVRRGGIPGIPSCNRAPELPTVQLSREDGRYAWAEEENLATYRTISSAFYNLFFLVSDGSLPQTAIGEGVGARFGPQRNRCRRDCIEGVPANNGENSRSSSPSVMGRNSNRNASSVCGRRSHAHAEWWEGGSRATSSSTSRISLGQPGNFAGSSSISSSMVSSGRGTELSGENDFWRDSKMGAVEFLQDLDNNHSMQMHAARRKQALKAVQQLWADLRSAGAADVTESLPVQEAQSSSTEATKGKGKKVSGVDSSQAVENIAKPLMLLWVRSCFQEVAACITEVTRTRASTLNS